MASSARCMFSQILTFPTYNRLEHSPELFICQLQLVIRLTGKCRVADLSVPQPEATAISA